MTKMRRMIDVEDRKIGDLTDWRNPKVEALAALIHGIQASYAREILLQNYVCSGAELPAQLNLAYDDLPERQKLPARYNAEKIIAWLRVFDDQVMRHVRATCDKCGGSGRIVTNGPGNEGYIADRDDSDELPITRNGIGTISCPDCASRHARIAEDKFIRRGAEDHPIRKQALELLEILGVDPKTKPNVIIHPARMPEKREEPYQQFQERIRREFHEAWQALLALPREEQQAITWRAAAGICCQKREGTE